ncbi:hypothetical protein LTR62_004748 [Meristemomyces frigidus]|uniref:NOT2/NOT3/NOT5 C-terminal domain-containing protein n=1 Tax=Meristemomyces frigidus TaxID=1508187 RepID=A0AAN7YNW6_9PEZI|nr:hypothetical protein LTR62_004748 [Meristemomyces frigidus]
MGKQRKKLDYTPLDVWEEREHQGKVTDIPNHSPVDEVIGPLLLADAHAMNSFPATQPSRQTPQLRNTQKSALGNGLNGWSTAGNGFGGLGGGGLAGASSLSGGALGGPGRPAQLSGFAQVIGGGSGQGPIDMSDFPSLSGGPRPSANTPSATGWNANNIRQVSGQSQAQPQQLTSQQPRAPSAAPSQRSLDQFDGQRQSQSTTDRAEDAFPPLSGQPNGGSTMTTNGLGSSIASPDISQQQRDSQQPQLPIRHPSNAYAHQPQAQPSPIGSGAPLSISQQPPATHNDPPANVKRYADMTESEQYGLPGMLAAFEAKRAIEAGQPIDETLPPAIRSGLFLGQELNMLGMDLDSPDPIYHTFTPFPVPPERGSGTFFDFTERNVVPEYTLPTAYTVTNVPPLEQRIAAFSDETLFSIFYQNPGDYKQELAAVELTVRDWRWHKILRQWLQKDTREASSSTATSLPIVDLATDRPVGTPAVRLGGSVERGIYVFFDAVNWQRQRREFSLDYGELDTRNAGGSLQQAIGGAGVQGAVGPAPGLTQQVGMGMGVGGPVQPPPGVGLQGGSIASQGGSQGGQQGAQRGL